MITNKDLNKRFPSEFSGSAFYAKFIRNSLKRFRVLIVKKQLKPSGVHIDLGCGDASLLKASPCEVRLGLDELYGDRIADTLDFPGNFADFITMAAFLEHLENPASLINESHRVLKEKGLLIITTPFKSSEKFLRLWNRNIAGAHKRYFDRDSMEEILKPYFKIRLYRKYFLNQLFVCERKN